jgi:hypothetical protein
MVLRPAGTWSTRALVVTAAALALLHTRLLRSPVLWLALAAFVGLRLVVAWPLSDNHAYLTAYWCLAMGLALTSAAPAAAAKLAARQLIALTFALAVIWKAFLSPDFLDGRFFRVTYLQDSRFTDVVMLTTGLSRDDIAFNREALAPPPPGVEPFDWQPLRETHAFDLLVRATTWGTLTVEAAIAGLFLAPLGDRAAWARSAMLILFCAATYALAPVPGFGWLLLAMGLAQCPMETTRWRTAYVTTFFLVLLCAEIPWAGLALDASRLAGWVAP